MKSLVIEELQNNSNGVQVNYAFYKITVNETSNS